LQLIARGERRVSAEFALRLALKLEAMLVYWLVPQTLRLGDGKATLWPMEFR